MTKPPFPALLALAGASAAPWLSAATPVEGTSEGAEETVKLEKFEVTDVPLAQQILPTARPFNSVFGTDDDILGVPRNVTIISRQQLKDINITSVLDFSKLTSSAYTTTNFGAPANPSIRGQSADLFINGVRGRITSNGNGLPLDFNSVESVNIVKGPATAVQGTSMYVGGFIDLVTKRPYFDAPKTAVSVTVGSYNKRNWTLDTGGPLSKTTAYRFSYSGEDSKGYWHNYYNKNHALYGALTFRPSDNYELFINASANFYRYTENWGLNRVTQDLIDHGTYRTGININNGAGATPSDPQNSVYVASGGNVIDFGEEVKISRHARLLKPGDHSTGREFNLQAIQTYIVSPETKVVNNSFASYTARNTLSSYYYSEIIDPSWFAENRTEIQHKIGSHSINTGLDLRYQKTKAYDQYFFEPANVWDLTKDLSYVDVYNSVNFPIGFPVPGWPNRYADPGVWNGDTNDSHATTVGPFAQTSWKLPANLTLIGGARYDYFSAHVREPLLPPYQEASIDVWIPNYNTSLVYQATPTSSLYVTYNYSKNTSGAVGNGGGITGWNASSTALDKENFQQPSELLEAGAKFSVLNNRGFLNFAVFDQERTAKSTSSTVIQEYKYKGFEAEFNYQPNKYVYATVSYSYIDARSSAPFQSDGGVADFGAANYVGLNRVSGLPRNLFNALLSYTFDNGLSLSANTVFTGEMKNNYAGTLTIPWQYQLDFNAAYRTKKVDYKVTVLNVTDQKNFAPPNAVYGNASILTLPGTQVQATVTYKF